MILILDFGSQYTQLIARRVREAKVYCEIHPYNLAIEKIRAMLTAIAEAENLGEIGKYAGWRLHPLTGDRRSTWSMVVTRNYRLTFRVLERGVREIDLEDYHGR